MIDVDTDTPTIGVVREAIRKLTKDEKNAAITLGKAEARFLVDAYYQLQDNRIRSDGQVRSMSKDNEPHATLQWLADMNRTLEESIKSALDAYSGADPVGQWMRAQKGIGPVIAAGFLAHLDITKAETAGAFWSFAGLDPRKTWDKGQKRPWNADLKVLCVHPEGMVTTRNGVKPIAEVEVGDEVLTHLGHFKRVLEVFENDYNGMLYGLRGSNSGNQVAWLSEGHPVFCAPAATWKNGRTIKIKRHQGWGWMAVDQIPERSLLSRPIISSISKIMALPEIKLSGVPVGKDMIAAQGRWHGVRAPRAHVLPKSVPIDADVARLIGFFISEGHITGNHIGFSFHKDETDYIEFVQQTMLDRFNISSSVSINELSQSAQVIATSKILSDYLKKEIGSNSLDMRIPFDWFDWPDEILEGVWSGIMDGDGDHSGQNAGRRISTANKRLAHEILALTRRLGHSASLHEEKSGKAFRIMINQRGDCFVTSRETLKRQYSGKVYNLEVEDDHSYIVDGYAVHNCWKLGESFVKVSGYDDAYYGKLYKQRKAIEQAKNEAGEFADQAKAKLEKFKIGKDTDAYKAYSIGKLPPAHIHSRATRWATKLFLAHLHHKMYVAHYGKEPPLPYAIGILGHAHMLKPPGL